MDKDLDIRLHPHQKEVFLDKTRFRVLVAGRRWGKTVLSCNELLTSALLNQNSLNWYVAPLYRQAKTIAWQILKDKCKELPRELTPKYNESELSILFPTGSRIELKGADTPESLLGVGVKFLVIDEVASIPNAERTWQEILRPMLSDTQGRALFIGTPKGLNYFYELFKRGESPEYKDFKSFRFISTDNPFLPDGEIEQAKEDLRPEIYKQEYLCSFLSSDQNILIRLEDIEDLRGNNFTEDNLITHISCDPAVVGGDECIVYVFENTKIIDEKSLNLTDTQKIAYEIVSLAHRYKARGISIDSVGVGKGVSDCIAMLIKEQDIKLLPISSGEKSSDDRFTNRRTEMWWYVWEQMKDKRIIYPEDLELRRQLSSVEYKIVVENKVALIPKAKTKLLLGRSPDRADAYVYGIWGLKHFTPKKETLYKRRQNKWFKQTRSPYGWKLGAYNA